MPKQTCAYCKKFITKSQPITFSFGKYAHKSCEEKRIEQQEKKTKYINRKDGFGEI